MTRSIREMIVFLIFGKIRFWEDSDGFVTRSIREMIDFLIFRKFRFSKIITASSEACSQSRGIGKLV